MKKLYIILGLLIALIGGYILFNKFQKKSMEVTVRQFMDDYEVGFVKGCKKYMINTAKVEEKKATEICTCISYKTFSDESFHAFYISVINDDKEGIKNNSNILNKKSYSIFLEECVAELN